MQCNASTSQRHSKKTRKAKPEYSRIPVRRQKEDTTAKDHSAHHRKDDLGLPTALNKSRLATVLHNGSSVVGEPICQTGQTQEPEDNAKGKSHVSLQSGGLFTEMERDDDRERDDG